MNSSRLQFSCILMLLAASVGALSLGAAEPQSSWSPDAFATEKGRQRTDAELGPILALCGTFDADARHCFREYRPGELQALRFDLSNGVWSGLKLTNAEGRPSNGLHFLNVEPSRLEPVLRSAVLVRGLAPGEPRRGRDGRMVPTSHAYVVPAAMERWLLAEFAAGRRDQSRLAELEATAFSMTAAGKSGPALAAARMR